MWKWTNNILDIWSCVVIGFIITFEFIISLDLSLRKLFTPSSVLMPSFIETFFVSAEQKKQKSSVYFEGQRNQQIFGQDV